MDHEPAPFRHVSYPLNVFAHIITSELGSVRYLHYGLFQSEDESLEDAQERSTRFLFERLAPPPQRVLDVGCGLGTTLSRLVEQGYDAEGITPDTSQIELIRVRHGQGIRVTCSTFESFEPGTTYDVIVFQESAQYIPADALFSKAERLAPQVLILDEFSFAPGLPNALPFFADFDAGATTHGFRLVENEDVSRLAAPTVRWFMRRIPNHRDAIIRDLGVTDEQIEALLESGDRYLARYASGEYGYRILRYERG